MAKGITKGYGCVIMFSDLLLTPKERMSVIDKALREHYCETFERRRCPNDYVLMFTEGGESDAVADAIARAQLRKAKRYKGDTWLNE